MNNERITVGQFHNGETNMTAFVFKAERGFGVCLRDDDSGMYLPTTWTGYKTVDAANVKADSLVRI